MLPLILAIALSIPQTSPAPPHRTKSDPCPLVLRVGRSGALMTYRFNGWRMTGMRTLKSDLNAGCYNDANPSKVTSVAVEVSKGAPAAKLNLVYKILNQNGWPQDKITTR